MKIFLFILLSSLLFCGFAQDIVEKKGKVSYQSSQNIYVNFGNTEGIFTGDTLFLVIKNDYIPAIVVKYLSSISAAGEIIRDVKLSIDDELIAFAKLKNTTGQIQEKDFIFSALHSDSIQMQPSQKINDGYSKVKGKFSVQSYTNFNNYSSRYDQQRWRYSFSLDANKISGSDFSFTNYMIFNYRTRDWQSVQSNIFEALKIYDLGVSYDLAENDELWFGRRLNRRLSNIGPVDGLQYEKRFSRWFSGLIVGSRPDYADLSFNFKLFQYGAFIGKTDTLASGYMDNAVSFMQQTNNSNTDRRFIYFQHSNNLFQNTSIFLSTEIDLYKKVEGEGRGDFSLTGLFLSLRYSPLKLVSFSLSYDARKNVIYYETFKSFTDSLIENETRQGVRAGINLRPFDNLIGGINAGYRFRPGDIKPSKNANLYLTWQTIPFIKTSTTLSYDYLTSSYIDGSIWDIAFHKNFLTDYNISLSYRRSDYKYPFTNTKSFQNNVMLDFSARLLKSIFFSITWEGTFEKQNTLGRLLLNLTTRF